MRLKVTDIKLILPDGAEVDPKINDDDELETEMFDDDIDEDDDVDGSDDDTDDDTDDDIGDEDGSEADDEADCDGTDDDDADDDEGVEIEKGEKDESTELAEDDIDDRVGSDVDPDDVFGDEMKFEIPELTLEQNDVIGEAIAGGISRESLHSHADLDARPYCPHPKAQAGDYEIVYDADSRYAQDRLRVIRSKVGTTSRVIGAQMRRVLAARASGTVERDRRAGKVDTRKLHTLNRPGVQPNTRIFQVKVPGEKIDTVIGVLTDQSGSMRYDGNKIGCAREANVALADALASLASLGVKFGVWGFDSPYASNVSDGMRGVDRTESLRLHVYKDIDENWNRVAARIGHMEGLDNNCDGECVRWAGQQLLNVKATRRILIVLSDGAPACGTASSGSRIDADLKLAVKQLADRGVETLGIGIQTAAVQNYYPNNIVITSARTLETTLMNALRNLMLGGRKRRVAS